MRIKLELAQEGDSSDQRKLLNVHCPVAPGIYTAASNRRKTHCDFRGGSESTCDVFFFLDPLCYDHFFFSFSLSLCRGHNLVYTPLSYVERSTNDHCSSTLSTSEYHARENTRVLFRGVWEKKIIHRLRPRQSDDGKLSARV